MRDHLDRAWRITATGVCFGVFGLGGLVLGAVVFPLLRLFTRDRWRRAGRMQSVVHHLFKWFVGLMQRLGVLSVEIKGAHKLDRRGLLVVANHPSLIDVVFLMSFLPHADCIVKAALARNPFTRGPVRAIGYICNDTGAGLVDDGIASIRRGNNLIIFPEGSRTPLTQPLPLQRGAAHMALRGRIDITPVRIRCHPPMLTKGVPWYRVPPRPARFILEVGDDIAVAPFLSAPSLPIAARHLTDHLTDHFSLEMHRAPH